jgi:hypothetical protein
MKIQINSDKQVAADAAFGRSARENIEQALERFEERITRVEVHLSDTNSSSKRGFPDKRCLMEARPAGEKPVSVIHEASSVEQALRGATGKLKRLLTSRFGKAAKAVRRSPAQAARKGVASPAADAKKAAPAKAAAKRARSARPAKTTKRASAPKRASTAKRKTTRRAEPAADGRSPKKKLVYRARRKAHPSRGRG